jgi:catalase
MLAADGQLAGTPSVTVDAIALVLALAAAEMLAKDGAAVQFVMDAFGHLKAFGATDGAKAPDGQGWGRKGQGRHRPWA